jgi:hypothetical protein
MPSFPVQMTFVYDIVFTGMLLKDFLNNFQEISYDWYKVPEAPGAQCYSTAATSYVLFSVFSQAAKDLGGNQVYEASFILEPYLNGASSLITPATGQWVNEISTKDRGYATLPIVASSPPGSTGWWVNKQFGQGTTPGGSPFSYLDVRASLAAWYTFLMNTQATFMSDAIITSVGIKLGSYQQGLTTYANGLSISSGSYTWVYNFNTTQV